MEEKKKPYNPFEKMYDICVSQLTDLLEMKQYGSSGIADAITARIELMTFLKLQAENYEKIL